jgi:hypothetical protein
MTARPLIVYLANLYDTTITSPANGDAVTYDSATGKWKNAPGGSLTAVGDITITSDSDASGAGDVVIKVGTAERARYPVGASLQVREPSTTASWLKLMDTGGTATPVEFQNIASAGSIAPALMLRPTNGGGPTKEAWQAFCVDTSASIPCRDLVLACKQLSNGTASDPDSIYGSYNGATTATPSSWGFGFAQPTADYRLHVLAGSGDLTQGAFAIHTNISQTGKPFVIYGGVATSSTPQFFVGANFALMHRASPPNRTVADGVLNSTTTVTSATAAFTSDDLGSYITGTGIASGTYIAGVTNATTVTLSAAATATASGVSLTVIVPQTTFQTNGNNPLFQINPGSGGTGGALGSTAQGFSLGPGAPAVPTTTLDIGTLGTNNAGIRVRTASQGGILLQANGASAAVTFQTTNASTLNIGTNATQAILITTAQSVLLGKVTITTTATDGFPYIPAAAGTPTGVPTTQAGFAPLYYDTTAHKIWVYDGGWKGVVVA